MKSFSYVTLGTKILSVIFIFAASLLPIVAIRAGSVLGLAIFFPIWILFSIMMLYNCFFKRVGINDNGVKFFTLFASYELAWSEIKEIGISNLYIGYRGGASIIYFSKQYNVSNRISTQMIGDNFILMRYRKSAIKEIRKYWAADIWGYHEK